jgi:primosomal protein N'
MQVVEIIPIIKGFPKGTLSYFTKEKFLPGNFVKIPLKGGSAFGIVERSVDARTTKSSLKTADFALRKITLLSKINGLSPSFIKAAEETAKFYATTTGSILGKILPKLMLENHDLIAKFRKPKEIKAKEVKLIQASTEERYTEYRSIVRENFAKKSSVLFIVPTHEDGRMALENLSSGIEKFVYTTLHGSKKKLKLTLEKSLDEKHPILLITTPAYLAYTRPDLETVVVERENSRGYKTFSRPYIDVRKFLHYYASQSGSNLILGDSVLSLETLWQEKEGKYSELSPLTWRMKLASQDEIVDMKLNKNFAILSERLIGMIKNALWENKKVFLFGARKGLSSTTICGDCASLLLCKNCKAPLALHKGKTPDDKPTYICHHCGAKRSSETRCDNCDSWKLTPLGVGVDRIKDECQKIFPDTLVLSLDKESTPTPAGVKEIQK